MFCVIIYTPMLLYIKNLFNDCLLTIFKLTIYCNL